jgi:hypothetical protein
MRLFYMSLLLCGFCSLSAQANILEGVKRSKDLVELLKKNQSNFCSHADLFKGKKSIRSQGGKYCNDLLSGYLAQKVCLNFKETIDGKEVTFKGSSCDKSLQDIKAYQAATKSENLVQEMFDPDHKDIKGKVERDHIVCPFLANTMSGQLLTDAKKAVGCK